MKRYRETAFLQYFYLKTIAEALMMLALLSGSSVFAEDSDRSQSQIVNYTRMSVFSERTNTRLTFLFPPGWVGPIKSAWPSFDLWYFDKDKCTTVSPPATYSSTITIRIDDFNSKHYSQQMKSWLDDSENYLQNYAGLTQVSRPTDSLEKIIAFFMLDGKKIPLWREDNNMADGGDCIGILSRRNSAITFKLNSFYRRSLSRYIPEFVKMVRSVRIEQHP